MKIAVTAQGSSLEAPVDPRFGRADTLIIYDTETQQHQVLDNRAQVNAAQGAGTQTAARVQQEGVDCVLTGHCGPNAFRTLTAAGIEVVLGAEGTVAQAIARYRSGELRPAASPDRAGHGF